MTLVEAVAPRDLVGAPATVVGGFIAWPAAGLPTTDGDGRTTYASTGRVPGRRPPAL